MNNEFNIDEQNEHDSIFVRRFETICIILLTIGMFCKIYAYPGEVYNPPKDSVTAKEKIYFQDMYDKFNKYGQFPFWDRSCFGGQPACNDLQLRVYYPFNLLSIACPSDIAVPLVIAIHFFCGGIFMTWFLRIYKLNKFAIVIGTLSFMLFGLYPLRENLPLMITLTWVPLSFLALDYFITEKSVFSTILLGFTIGFQFLGSDPAGFVFFNTILIMVAFCKIVALFFQDISIQNFIRLSIKTLTAIAFFIITAAARLFPLYDLTPSSIHVVSPWSKLHRTFSFSPAQIHGIFFNNDTSGYIGILIIVLSIVAWFYRNQIKYVWTYTLISIFALLFAFGKYIPFYYFVSKIFPWISSDYSPINTIYMMIFGLSVLSAFGIQGLMDQSKTEELTSKPKKIIKDIIVIAIILGVFTCLLHFAKELTTTIIQYTYKLYPREIPIDKMTQQFRTLRLDTAQSVLYFSQLFLACSFVALLITFSTKRIKPAILGLLVFSTLIYTANVHNTYIKTETPIKLLDSPIFTKIKDDYSNTRFMNVGKWDYLSIPGYHTPDIERVGGTYNFINKYYSEYVQHITNLPKRKEQFPIEFANINNIMPNKFLSLLNVKYIISDQELKNSSRFSIYDGSFASTELMPRVKVRGTDIEHGKWYLYENTDIMPRAYIVPNAIFRNDHDEILNIIQEGGYWTEKTIENDDGQKETKKVFVDVDLQKTAVLQGSQPDMFYALDTTDYAEGDVSLKWNNSLNSVNFNVSLPFDRFGFLVLSDPWAPGWEAYIDGHKADIYKANYLFRGIFLRPGNHTVVFKYRPFWLKFGIMTSLFSLVFVVLFATFRIHKMTEKLDTDHTNLFE